MHAEAVHGSQKPFGLVDQCLLSVGILAACGLLVQDHDQSSDDGGNSPVAALGLGCQDRFDARRVAECHPHTGIYCQFFVQRQELTEEGQDSGVLFRASGAFPFHGRHGGLQPSYDSVNDNPKREDQQFVAAGKVVPY